MPDDEPTAAMEVLLLVHVPPAAASVSAVMLLTHILVYPVMGAGFTLTIAVVEDTQPNELVNV